MVTSPCVRNCCLNENDICLGCFRILNEILSWQESTDAQKNQILTQCEIRKNNYSSDWQIDKMH